MTGKPPFRVCGACGCPLVDPNLYTDAEMQNPELDHCGCEYEEEYQPTTQDLIDAGYLDRDGNPL